MKNIHKTPSKSINRRTSGKQSLTALWKTFQQFSSSRSTKTSSISSRCPFTFETPSRNSFSERFRQKNKVSNVNIRGDLKIFFSFKAKLWPQANSISIKFLTLFFTFLLIQTLSILYILLNSNIINCLGLHTKITHFIFLCFKTL